MSTKGLLIVIAIWFVMLWVTACTPVYIPQKVMVKVPVYCHPAKVPSFVNYISPVVPKTELEMRELTAEVEVTMEEAVEQNRLLREALKGCGKK